MAETVSVPREEYELLLKCRRIVESDFEEEFSEEFIRAIRRSRRAYREGRYRVALNAEERGRIFREL